MCNQVIEVQSKNQKFYVLVHNISCVKAFDRRTRAFKHMKFDSPSVSALAPAPSLPLSLPPPPPQQSLPATVEETPLEVLANYASYSYDYYTNFCKHFVDKTQPCHMCG